MDNRTNVINCAIALFAQKGFDAVGVQELVNCAEITKPTLYHYFGNKRGVLDAIFTERFQPYLDQLAKAARYEHNLPYSIQKALRTTFEFANANQAVFRLYLTVAQAPPQSESFAAANSYMETQFNIIQSMFEQAAQDHGNMKNRHTIYAIRFVGMINTYIYHSYLGQIELDENLINQSVQQFQYGIYS